MPRSLKAANSPTGSFASVVAVLQERGVDVSACTQLLLRQAAGRRMQQRRVQDYDDYAVLLCCEAEERERLARTLRGGPTSFFDDLDSWIFLVKEAVPRLLARLPADAPIRVWCAGCSTGQEAYGLAMLFAEALGPQGLSARIRVFGTDVDEVALTAARAGRYRTEALDPLPASLRRRYFDRHGNVAVVTDMIRDALVFGRIDIADDPPIGGVHLLACRHRLGTFGSLLQTRILQRFHFSVRPGGILFLGANDSGCPAPDSFQPLSAPHGVYEKAPTRGNPADPPSTIRPSATADVGDA